MKLRMMIAAALMMCLTSCFDIQETFDLKPDGSGVYQMKMDMSRAAAMLSMMKQGMGKDAGGNTPALPTKMDSVIYTKDLIDTVTTLSATEKAALSKSYSKIHMDEDEGEMFIEMFYPFANAKELEIIMQAINKGTGSGGGNVMDMLGGVLGKNKTDLPPGLGDDSKKKPSLPFSSFSYSLTDHSLVRKVKPAANTNTKKAEPGDEEMPEQFKEMMKINHFTVINLPAPLKSVTGKDSKVSEDKKQVKFKKAMSLDDAAKPEEFEFSIEY